MENDTETEIDLHKYLDILIRYWRWIIATTVVVALATLIGSFLQPRVYSAVALVAITQPQYTLNFDPRIVNMTNNAPAFKSYLDLIKASDLLQSVLTELDPRPAGIENLSDLDNALTVKAGADTSFIRLTVQARNPADAARVANIWATIATARINATNGTLNPNQLKSFEAEAANANKELQTNEQALIDNQAHDQSLTLQTELSSAIQMQSDYLADQRNTTYLLQDIAGLRDQLSKQPSSRPSGLADRLTALGLQIKAYKVQANAPIQLQFSNSDAIASAGVGEQIAFLDGLSNSLKARLADSDARLNELKPRVLALQQELQQLRAEKDRITRGRDVARQTAMTLAQKVEENRISAQVNRGNAQLASSAIAPETPVNSNKLANTALGGIAGMLLSIAGVFIVEWIRNRRTSQPQVREAAL